MGPTYRPSGAETKRMNALATKENKSAKRYAAVLVFGLFAASCGTGSAGEAGVSAEESKLEKVSETAEEALEVAEDVERAVESLEREVSALETELANLEHNTGEDDGHGDSAGGGESSDDHGEPAEGEAASPPHWGYEGEEGPAKWATLSDEFAVCEAGVQQSPIDIAASSAFMVGLDDLQTNWSESTIEVIDNGHTIQANVASGNTTTFDGAAYDLLQFHFHRPSEHTVDNEVFPMELHFVHADASGNLAVVGVLLGVGDDDNEAFASIWNAQAAQGEDAAIADFDLGALLPDDLARFRYSGSLTTPPCSEGVNWNVLSTPVALSQAQIDSFLYSGNARPVQGVNNRAILVDQS